MNEVRVLKKIFVFILAVAFLAAISGADAQLVATHGLPTQMEFGKEFTGTIDIIDPQENNIDISILLPVTWEITSWDVEGNISEVMFEKTTVSYKGKVSEAYHWLFDGPVPNDMKLTYNSVPSSSGNKNVTLLWFYPEGFGSTESSVFVLSEEDVVPAGSNCGDRICQSAYGETLLTCPLDCAFRFKENIVIWLAILIIALIIIFLGIAYRIYLRIKRNKLDTKMAKAKPVVERYPDLGKPYEAPKTVTVEETTIIKEVPVKAVKKKPVRRVKKKPAKRKTMKPKVVKRTTKKAVKKKPAKKKAKKKTVKTKPAKKKVKKPGKKKPAKKKTAKRAGKHTDFYSTTMKRLSKIKKDLK